MRSLILFLFFIGVFLIMKGQQMTEGCMPPRIEYRFIPQTFEEQQYQQLPIMATYGKLFTHTSPWEDSIGYPGIFYDKQEV